MDTIEEPTAQRILDAAFDCVARSGASRARIGEVARIARISRQTVYRYFPTKHALFAALVVREERRLSEEVRAATSGQTDLLQAIEASILTALRWLRAHPLLDSLLKAEPQELLPYLTLEANPIIGLTAHTALEVFAERFPNASPEVARRAAEVWGRLMLSYALTPSTEGPEALARGLAELFCNALGGSRDR